MTDPVAALENAILDACLDPAAGDAIATDLRGFLERRSVAPDDIAAILDAPARLHVYRALVRNGLSAIVARVLPRTRARMNAAHDGRLDADYARFVHEAPLRSHYLRDVPAEFFRWAKPRWEQERAVSPYLVDLAAYELARFEIASAPDTSTTEALGELTLERAVVFDRSVRLVRCAWAVHELPDEAEADEDSPLALLEPQRRDVALVGYRDVEHRVRWVELTPLATAVVERLLSGEPLGASVARACEDRAIPVDARAISLLLADLAERGVVRGGAAA
jgi:hypothetical protein